MLFIVSLLGFIGMPSPQDIIRKLIEDYITDEYYHFVGQLYLNKGVKRSVRLTFVPRAVMDVRNSLTK
jgi:hypothetical protein